MCYLLRFNSYSILTPEFRLVSVLFTFIMLASYRLLAVGKHSKNKLLLLLFISYTARATAACRRS
jgi:hypothetical protein